MIEKNEKTDRLPQQPLETTPQDRDEARRDDFEIDPALLNEVSGGKAMLVRIAGAS